MATAPRPGAARKAAETEQQARKTAEITVRGETVRLVTSSLGPREDAMVRRETNKALGFKVSLRGVMQELADEDSVGLDTVAVMWWLARHKDGVTQPLGEVLDAFPTYEELGKNPDAVKLRVVEPGEDEDEGEEDDSPEA